METRSLSGKVALVTGGASGMGLAHAVLLAQRGARVIITDLHDAALAAARAQGVEAGVEILGLRADSRVVAEIDAVVAQALGIAGKIDILVNNAGVSGNSLAIEEIDDARFTELFDTHVKGAFFFARAVVPGMKARRWGRVINMSSNFAMTGHDSMSHYVAAKSALLGFTKAWARELAPWQITVNAVAPGLIDTPMTRASIGVEELAARAATVPLGRLARPGEISFSVAWLASDEAAMTTGQVMSPNGGVSIVGI